jgi:hypothetical protein
MHAVHSLTARFRKPALGVFPILGGFEIKEYSYRFRFHPVFQEIFQTLY